MPSLNAGPITGAELIRARQGGAEVWLTRAQFVAWLSAADGVPFLASSRALPFPLTGRERIRAVQFGTSIHLDAADMNGYQGGSGVPPIVPERYRPTLPITGAIRIFGTQGGALVEFSPPQAATSISIAGGGVLPLSITGTPASATVGSAYSFTPTVAGGSGTKAFTLTGSLPAGLTFSTGTGAISGTPTAAGTTSGLNITVTDDSGSASLGVFSLTVAAVAQAGTSAARYSPVGTGFRPAVLTWSNANTYQIFDTYTGMPDWPITEFYLMFPAFYATSSKTEIATTATIQIDGISIRNDALGGSSGAWTLARVNNGGAAPFLDPATGAESILVKVDNFGTITAGAMATIRVHQTQGAGTVARAGKGTGAAEGSMGSTSSLTGRLTDGSTLTNTGSTPCRPIAMMAKGGDGRPSVFMIGDSIGYGADAASFAAFATARNEVGYLAAAMDDNTGSKRLPYLNWCIPGWGVDGTNNHGSPSACPKYYAALQKLVSLNASGSPFDIVVSEHGTNSNNSSLPANLKSMYGWLRNLLGSSIHIMQTEMLPYPASSDGYATLGNQVPAAANAYPSGTRWTTNDLIGKGAAQGDPTASFRTDGSIQSSVAPWRATAADLTTNRDKLAVRSFSTTLAAAWTTGTSASLTTAPIVGMEVSLYDGTNTRYAAVTAVTGSGPYTCTLSLIGSTLPSGGFASGTAVREALHGEGLHPSLIAHNLYRDYLITNWKVPQGYTA